MNSIFKNNGYIETHAHMNVKAFSKDRDDVLKEMFKYHFFSGRKIEYLINPAINFESNDAIIDMIEKSKYKKRMFFITGIHPNAVNSLCNLKMSDEEIIASIIKNTEYERTVAIGETGLDYNRSRNKLNEVDDTTVQTINLQKKWFKNQIQIADDTKLPLCLHIRNAFDDSVNSNEPYNDAYGDGITILKESMGAHISGVVHSFNGSALQAQELLKMGFYFGVNGSITYPSETGEKYTELQLAVKDIPLDRIVLETDSPYLSPYKADGTRCARINTPMNLDIIAEKLSCIKGVTVKEVKKVTNENAIKVFNLKK